ncbi:MAG: hypothetical protein IPM48_05115 [Saprospiraceae bacterium]|nr:hypothetical protein [Saprospiraceae bacterium]
MKNLILFLVLLLGFSCNSQNSKAKMSLDGRKFKIETSTGGKMEGTENMMFAEGQVENDVCTQWGFGKAPYSVDESGMFKFTLTSEKEGKMDWEGQVAGSSISGKYVWIKAGQDDIQYTFKGEEKSE